MLILSRKLGQAIIIGKEHDICVKVLSIKNFEIKLGIEAPKDTPIYRDELLKRILSENNEDVNSN